MSGRWLVVFYDARFRCHVQQVVLGGLVLGTGQVSFVISPPLLIARVHAEVGQSDLWWSRPQPPGLCPSPLYVSFGGGEMTRVWLSPCRDPRVVGLILGLTSLNSI